LFFITNRGEKNLRKKGIVSLVALGLLASSLYVGTVKADGNDFELSKKAMERQVEKPLEKGVVDHQTLIKLGIEVEGANLNPPKDSKKIRVSSYYDEDYIFEQEYNDDFYSANATQYGKPTIGQLLPYYDFDFHKVVVPRSGVLLVGGDTNSYAIDLSFLATEKDWGYSGKLEYLGTEYEDGVEIQGYQAKAGTYYIPVYDNDSDSYDDNTEYDLYAIATEFVDNVAPSKPTVNKVDNNDKSITGKAEKGSTVTVKSGKTTLGSATATSKGTFAVAIKVQKTGTNLTITAKDSAGNVSSSASVTVVDGTPPSQPTVNKVDRNDTSVTGTAERYSTVTIKKDGRVMSSDQADSKGNYSAKINPQKSGTVLSINAKDKSGNISQTKSIKVVKK
jgi:hypothetical protein